MKAILLDIDGVVCEPQQPISKKMDHVLRSINGTTAEVFFVTGNSYTKAADMIGAKWRIFSNNADEMRRLGVLHWQDTETPALSDMGNYLSTAYTAFDTNKNNAVEWRSPRFVNFSPIGRYASSEERDKYPTHWRSHFIERIKQLFDVEAVIGGQVSVDIYSKGADKSRAGKWLNDNGYTFTFFGDKTAPGGNDYPLAKYCEDHPENKCFTVTGLDETLRILSEL